MMTTPDTRTNEEIAESIMQLVPQVSYRSGLQVIEETLRCLVTRQEQANAETKETASKEGYLW